MLCNGVPRRPSDGLKPVLLRTCDAGDAVARHCTSDGAGRSGRGSGWACHAVLELAPGPLWGEGPRYAGSFFIAWNFFIAGS